MGRKINLIRHVSKEELERLYKNEKDVRMKERYHSIILLYDGMTFSEASKILKRGSRALMVWKKRWNEEGIDGLKPRKQKGKPPVMPRSEWKKVKKEIKNKGMDLKQVTVYVKDSRGIECAYKTAWKWMRKELKTPYGKPFMKNAKRPGNAEAVLKKDSKRL